MSWQRWERDPAYSGLRLRTWRDTPHGRFEICAYIDGHWFVARELVAIAQGVEPDALAAARRALRVFRALST